MKRLSGMFAATRSVEAAAIAGVVYALAVVSTLAILNQAPATAPATQEITAWLIDSNHRTELILALNLAAISSIAFLWFVAVLRRRLAGRADEFFSTVFFGSAMAYVACWLAAAAAVAAPAIAGTVLRTVNLDVSSIELACSQGAALILVVEPRLQAVFVISATTIIRRSGALHGWFVVFGYAVGLALLITPIVARPVGLAFPIWVFVAGVTLLVVRADPSKARALNSPDRQEPAL